MALALLVPGVAAAQEVSSDPPPVAPAPGSMLLDRIRSAAAQEAPVVRIPDYESPECPGCPRRSWGKSVLGAEGVNVMFSLINLSTRGGEERDQFKVTPKTWWSNLKYGFVFDDNNFGVNQFGHPYQGGMYFNAGRENGLNYWESAMFSALGSFSWECCGETNRGSINDFYATTLGGMVLGEVFHRLAGLVRDNTAINGRGKKELLATAIDPVGGAMRAINGEWGKVKANPPDQRPDYLGVSAHVGALWRGAAGTLNQAKAYPYVELDFLYGDPIRTPSRKPFDTFQTQFVLGGGKGISELAVSGRLWGRSLKDSPDLNSRLQITQGFAFLSNPAFDLGGQWAGVGVVTQKRLGSRSEFYVAVAGQFVPLAAISAEYVDVNQRTYDYGPAGGASLIAAIRHKDETVLRILYNSYFIKAVNGSGGTHVAQVYQVRGSWPLTRRLSAGGSFSAFVRNSYYRVEPDTRMTYPESRIFVGVRF